MKIFLAAPYLLFRQTLCPPVFTVPLILGPFLILAYVGSLYNIQGFVSWRVERGMEEVCVLAPPSSTIYTAASSPYIQQRDGWPGSFRIGDKLAEQSPKSIEGECLRKIVFVLLMFRETLGQQAQQTDVFTEKRSCTSIYIRVCLPTLSCRNITLFRRFFAKLGFVEDFLVISLKTVAGKQRWAEGGTQRTGTQSGKTRQYILYIVTFSPNIRPPPAYITRDIYIVQYTLRARSCPDDWPFALISSFCKRMHPL